MPTEAAFAHQGMTTPAHWRAEDIALGMAQTASSLPLIAPADVRQIIPDLDLWDMWQLQRLDGSTAIIDSRAFWFFLAAPQFENPNDRHDQARIRLLSRGADGWRDHGHALPEGFTPGSREWSGSAVLHADDATVSLYFTASGSREGGAHFEQRLFVTEGVLRLSDAPQIDCWSTPQEMFRADGIRYAIANEAAPTDDMILGFRDPGFFRDPADGTDYMLFTGSAAGCSEQFDGVIGIARRDGLEWTLLPPLVEAIGVSKELERAHIVAQGGLYYLFWSTQAARFAPGVAGRTGLYGMVAERIAGPWRPLNGSTLVAANPIEEPRQAYCWWVTSECDVISFIDHWGLKGRRLSDHPELLREQFGGTVAPGFRLILSGDRATID